MLEVLGSFHGRAALLATLPHEDTRNLNNTDASEEEVDRGKAKEGIESVEVLITRTSGKQEQGTYRTLRGLMIKHQRVQIAPVAIRAAFWVRESFSAGRAKSETPAITRAHCPSVSYVFFIYFIQQLLQSRFCRVVARRSDKSSAYQTGRVTIVPS